MILNRLGNKEALVSKILPHFPKQAMDCYMEPFFGAGGMFFNKPKARHNFVADADSDVYNLFRQLVDNKDEIVRMLEIVPITERQLREWAKGKREDTDMLNAVRFILVSNFLLYGKLSGPMRTCPTKPKQVILSRIDATFEFIRDVYFLNCDFRDFFRKVDFNQRKQSFFCYMDPPYLETENNYKSGFTEQDSRDLFDIAYSQGIKCAMSEFDHPFILEQARQRNLNVIYIGERTNLMNKRTEILVTNYDTPQLTLF